MYEEGPNYSSEREPVEFNFISEADQYNNIISHVPELLSKQNQRGRAGLGQGREEQMVERLSFDLWTALLFKRLYFLYGKLVVHFYLIS